MNPAWPIVYGAAAAISLGYETVWLKQLAQFFGASSHAVTVTLAVYILGIATGGWLSGRLLVFAAGARRCFTGLQVFVGAWSLALPWLFGLADAVYLRCAPPDQTLGHQLLRVLLVFAVLMPPATAMGAVFPVLSSAGVGRMFVAGTFGSLLGVFGVALLALPSLGLTGSLRLLALLNLAVAAVAWRCPETVGAGAEGVGREAGFQSAAWIVGVLGFSLFAAQGVWFKLVWLVVDATAYAEGMVIAAVLLAMTLGAAFGNRRDFRTDHLLLGIAGAQLAVIVLMEHIARLWLLARPAAANSFPVYCLCLLALALLVVGPAAFGYGLAIPRFCRGFAPANVGRLWCFHHLGCTLGILAGGFVIVPLVGVTWTLAIATWLVLLPLARTEARKPSLAMAVAALLLGCLGDATYARVAARPLELVLHHEDGGGIVEVYQDRNGHRRLMSSRLRQEGGDEPEQVHNELRQGRLPVALHPAPKRVLVIGMGTAISLRGALSDQVERLVCVEISRGVIRGARLFAEANGNVLEEPRVDLVEQDGRNFIKLTDERYDLIVQELFFPYRAGVGALYTVDHFRRAKTRLNPGGQFAQWISLAQIGRTQLASLVRTFTEVFPESSGWLVGGYFMLIGGEERLALTRDTAMLGHFFGARKLAEWASSAPLNTEDNLSIEFSVPRAFRELNTTGLTVENLRALMAAEEAIEAYDDRLPGSANAASRRVRQATLQRFDGDNAAAIGNYEQALLLDPGNFLARRAMIAEYEARNDHRALLRLDPEHVGARFNYGVELYKGRQYEEASRQFEFVLRREPGNPDAVFNLANSQAQIGRYTNAVTLYERLLRMRPGHADARANLAELKRVVGQSH